MNYICSVDSRIITDRSIPASSIHLYLLISGLAWKAGYCWASNKYLSEKMGMDIEFIQEGLQKLEKTGYILRERDEKGRRRIWCLAHKKSVPIESIPPPMQGVENTPEGEGPYIIMKDYYKSDINMSTPRVDDAKTSVAIVLPGKVSNKIFEHDGAPYLLAESLLALVEKGPHPKTYSRYTKTPEGREAMIQKFAYFFDLVIRIDNRPIDEITDLLGWSQKDLFWKGVIRSGDSFRRHYEEMLKQMKERGFGSKPDLRDDNPALTKEILGVYRRLINNPGFRPNDVEQAKLIDAASRCERFFRRREQCERSTWPELLLECLDQQYTNLGQNVYIGHMNSEFTWSTLMPQYIARCGLE